MINYATTRIIKNIIKINDKISTILVSNNINIDILTQLNNDFSDKNYNFKSYEVEVKSNVAIVAAVTAYARIHMMEYKMKYEIYYSDTDSIFIHGKLDEDEIGFELGQMKDELNGQTIEKAIFLGIKEYGYKYTYKNGNTINRSVFAGIPRDLLSFKEVEDVFNGKKIVKTVPTKG